MWQKIWHNNYLRWGLVILLAIGFRIYAISLPAHPYDIDTFRAWGSHILKVGAPDFYQNIWSDYLPLPLYFTGFILYLSSLVNLPFELIFKSITSLLELGMIISIVRASKTKGRLSFFLLLALSPALFLDSSLWGQLDTFPALLTLYSFLTLSPITFGLAVAIKPIILLVAPLFSALTLFATAIPMAGFRAPILLFERALAQASTYPFTTINAWNIWSLVPPTIWPPDNQIVFGLSAQTAGLVMFGISFFLLMHNWFKAGWSSKFGPRVASTILIIFFVFATRMHERHLLFALPLLTLATLLESWLILPLVILTLTFSLNLYSAYYWVNHDQIWPFNSNVTSIVSWVNTIIGLGLASIWHWPAFIQKVSLFFNKNKILVSILILATFLRFINLAHPPVYIFDEVYHAFTSREYLNNHQEAWEWWTTPPEGVAYEWTHPPVAKYGMVLGMLLFGENSFGWRVGSSIFGVISILGLYLFVLALTKNKFVALLSAFLVSIEGTHIAQSRIAMNDIYLLCFYLWSLYFALISSWKKSAVLFGLALASKWSALYGVIPLGLIYLHQFKVLSRAQSRDLNSSALVGMTYKFLLNAIRLLLIAVSVYVLTFTPFTLAGHSWAQLIELHRQMWYYHTHLVATHAYQSAPWDWLFVARPVWYWVNYAGDYISHIYVQGNPIILWLGLVAFVLQLKYFFKFPYLILNALYLILVLPWLLSPRIMFYYHYLPSATFLCVILALWISTLPCRVRLGLIALCLIGLIIVSPMLFGIPIATTFWNTFFAIFPTWK
jgi:dolichyl-phosphate-mannose-protein mannosyltransferase